MDTLPYNPNLRLRARELRTNSTLAEVLLWNQLKRGQRLGHDFHRQKPILEWIADFYSAELKLVIEIDGDSHRGKQASDAAKESAFRSLGLCVLRFGDTAVKQNPEGIAVVIDDWIRANYPPRLTAGEHTPAFGHPSREGTQTSEPRPRQSPLERGAAKRRGVFVRKPRSSEPSDPRTDLPP